MKYNEKLINDVERLKALRVIDKDVEIANQTGFSRSAISNFLSGRIRASENFLKVFYEHFSMLNDKNFVLTADETKTRVTPTNNEETNTFDERGMLYSNHPDSIPALPIRVQGGFSLQYNDPVFWEHLERIYIPGLPFKGDKFLWAEMEGDSMEYYDKRTGKIEGIRDRQWCLYEEVPKEFWRTGLKKYYVHLVITETMFTVKRILQDNEEEIVLSPDNELYEQERIHLNTVQAIYLFKRKLDWNAPPPRKHEIKV